MPTHVSLHQVIKGRFQTLVGDVEDIPVQYPNVPFNKPEGEPWMRLTIFDGDSSQVSMGSTLNRFRSDGLAIVNVFVPVGSGSGEATRLAEVVKKAFLAVTVSGVIFRTPSITHIGEGVLAARPTGEYQVNVSIPFRMDEVT